MRILHVTGMEYPTKFGGLEKWFCALSHEGKNQGCDTFVAYSKSVGNISVYRESLNQSGGDLVLLENSKQILAFCREQKITTVHFHFSFCEYYSLYPKLHNIGCRLFLHLHCECGYYTNQSWKKNPILLFRLTGHRLKTQYISRYFSGILGCSKTVTNQHQQFYHYSKKKMHLLYLGIARTSNDSPAEHSHSDVPTIICIAFHSPIKGVDVLLDALSILKTKSIPFRLIQIGGGSSELNGEDTLLLYQQCNRLNLANQVEWIGITNQVDDYLSLGDIYCQPSRTEALSLSIAEAMQHKLPIVASCVGGIPELVHDEKNGFLTPPGDADALSSKLELLIKDSHLQSAMGNASAKILEEINYYHDESAKRLFEIYQKSV